MTAKEAIQQELGDFFATMPTQTAVVRDEIIDESDSQAEEDVVLEEDDGFLDDALQFGAEEGSDDSTPDDGIEDASDDGIDELLANMEFSADDGTGQPIDGSDGSLGMERSQLTPEETTASIEAANEAMDNTKMSPEMLDWGLGFLTKMYRQQNEQLRARLAQSDRNAARARYKQMADEEEAQERAEKEQYLRG